MSYFFEFAYDPNWFYFGIIYLRLYCLRLNSLFYRFNFEFTEKIIIVYVCIESSNYLSQKTYLYLFFAEQYWMFIKKEDTINCNYSDSPIFHSTDRDCHSFHHDTFSPRSHLSARIFKRNYMRIRFDRNAPRIMRTKLNKCIMLFKIALLWMTQAIAAVPRALAAAIERPCSFVSITRPRKRSPRCRRDCIAHSRIV